MDIQEEQGRIRDLIRAGRSREARGRIDALCARRLPREHRLGLAFLANSAEMPLRAARILHPVVHPKARGATPATDGEKIEYAASLTLMGCVSEAIGLLGTVDAARCPRAHSRLAFCLMLGWDFDGALGVLRRGLRQRDLSRTEQIRLRLLASLCFIHGSRADYSKAEELVSEALDLMGERGFRMLRYDALQIRVQIDFVQGDWAGALACLDRIDQTFSPGELPVYDLITRKWRLLIDLHQARNRRRVLRELSDLRKDMAAAGRGEQARSTHYYTALCLGDEKLLARLVFGTPFPAFREKILREMGTPATSLPASYDLALGKPGGSRVLLEAMNGHNTLNRATLKPGHLPQRLLAAIVSDFYVPQGVYQLHATLYPERHFNPESSPDQVRQATMRLRRWLEENRLPLRIEESRGRYSLVSTVDFRLRISTPWGQGAPGAGTRTADLLSRLKGRFGTVPFSSTEVASLLGVSRPTAVSRLAEACEAGLVSRAGQSSATRYLIK